MLRKWFTDAIKRDEGLSNDGPFFSPYLFTLRIVSVELRELHDTTG